LIYLATITITIAITTGVSTGAQAAPVSQDDFLAATRANMVSLCSAVETDPLVTPARNFCQGFLVGTYRMIIAVQADTRSKRKMFCVRRTVQRVTRLSPRSLNGRAVGRIVSTRCRWLAGVPSAGGGVRIEWHHDVHRRSGWRCVPEGSGRKDGAHRRCNDDVRPGRHMVTCRNDERLTTPVALRWSCLIAVEPPL
jgi:hypothetical protein